MSNVNLLFTSAGRRVELLRAFRRAYEALGIGGSITITDIDPLAPTTASHCNQRASCLPHAFHDQRRQVAHPFFRIVFHQLNGFFRTRATNMP